MSSQGVYTFIPAFAAATGLVEKTLNNVEIIRPPNPDGAQDDHSSAFELLKQVLLKQMELSRGGDDNIHVTPVFVELQSMTKRELHIYTAFMLEQNVLNELSNIHKSYFPDSEDIKLTVETAVTEIEGIIEKINKKIKKTLVEKRDKELLKNFLKTWGQVIPYLDLNELQQNLNDEITKADELIKGSKKEAYEFALLDLKKKEGDPLSPEEEKSMHDKMRGYLACFYQRVYPPAALNSISNTFSGYLNKLPFATFKKVVGVSGTKPHGGKYVSAAIKKLKATDFSSLSEETIGNIVKEMGVLLDFHPIPDKEIKEIDDQLESLVNVTGKFEKKAVYTLLMRNDNPDVFSQVVARHWRLMCIAFPEINQDAIKERFIESMFERWEIKSKTSQATYTKNIEKLIKAGEKIPDVLLPPMVEGILSPVLPSLTSVTSEPSSTVTLHASPDAISTAPTFSSSSSSSTVEPEPYSPMYTTVTATSSSLASLANTSSGVAPLATASEPHPTTEVKVEGPPSGGKAKLEITEKAKPTKKAKTGK